MVTVKQYAQERGITIQAVHQSMQGKYKRDRLKGHVSVVDGVKHLDEEAVRILDEARQKAPIVWEKADADERIEELEREREQLLLKVASQADTISELYKWKADNALAIAAAEQTRALLDGTRAELEQAKLDAASSKVEVEKARQEAVEASRRAQEGLERAATLSDSLDAEKRAREVLESEIEALKGRGLFARIFRKGE